MDFARIAVLVLALTMVSIEPATASSPSGAGSSQSITEQPSTTHGAALSQAAPSGAVSYGAPYRYGNTSFDGSGSNGKCVGNYVGHAEPSIDAAAQDYLNQFNYCYFPAGTSSCTYSITENPPGSQDVAYLTLVSGGAYSCWGSDDIYATTYSNNLGNGINGGDGEGDQVSDAAPNVGDPVNASSGNKYLKQDDYLGTPWLTFRRFYNSSSAQSPAAMGIQWRHSFDRSLAFVGSPASTILMYRPDGSKETFTKVNGSWTAALTYVDQLTEIDNAQGVAIGYTVFIGSNRHTEAYSTAGLLLSVTDQTGQGITLTYSTSSTPTSVAPKAGLLLTVTDSNNRQLSFSYDSLGHLNKVTLPDGGALSYSYDSGNNLASVQYPDAKTRQYVYDESSLTENAFLPNALTGIIDEGGVRYASTGYDSSGNAVLTGFANNVDVTQITYNSDGTSTIQYPLGHGATMAFSQMNGLNQIGSIDQSCGPDCNQRWKTRAYDTNGYPASYTDFNNNLTTTQYNAYGELTVEVDASGTTSQRTINTTWDTTLRVPLTRTVLDENGNAVTKVSWVYNTMGQPLARCVIDPAKASSYICAASGTAPAGVRRWTYTYCTTVGTGCPLVGLLLTATGPRTDLTQTTKYAYYTASSATSCGTPGAACYQAGDLHTITDALGHVTTIASYDADGRVTRITDPNGVNTDSTYTPRGWLATRIVGGATTTFTYWPYGAVETIKDPDGVLTSYTYDAAHRLTRVTDDLGNYVQYTLDGAGNKTAEQTFTKSGTAVRSLSRTFNALGQLTAVVDGLGHTVFNAGASSSYDANGNLLVSTDALGIQHQHGLDPLNRLVSTIDNYNGTDPATKNTQSVFSRDALNRLEGVSDPDGLNTLYTYDGLGNRVQLQSPDTGTSADTYDAAGDRLTHTDANGIVSTSTYDALNRLASTRYADNTLNVAYTYDESNKTTGCSSSKPVGRLTRVVEGDVTTVYCYDVRGNILQKTQVTSGHSDITQYTWSAGNRLRAIRSPDNTYTVYTLDGDGRNYRITTTPAGGTATVLINNIAYLPFGPISSYTQGNGQTVRRTYDANYRLTDLTSPALALHFARDGMGNITALGNAKGANPATETYSYDPLNRLTTVTEANGSTLESYTYNPTGDRLSKVTTGLAGGVYGYTAGTHKLASIGNTLRANDADGNTTGSVIGANTYGFGYNGRNRLALTQLNGQTVGTYTYNAVGERIGKVASFPQAVTERYAYDEAGTLLGEYGTTNRDYVWLNGMPVAAIDNTISGGVTTSTINYITADQLGTPRVVTNTAGAVIWQWTYQGNPFGEQQPTSSTGYVLNLRYPGQYYDEESGTNYNLLRNYEPAVGRYQQSDPIGLAGGASTYAYAGGNPMYFADSNGQCPWCIGALVGAVAGGIAGYETGGWKGALIGGVVGGAVGAVAPWAATSVGGLAAEATGSLLAGQVATVATLSALNSGGAALGTVTTNYVEDQPLSQDMGSAAVIGAVAPIMEGVTIANGVDGVVGGLMSTLSGLNSDFLTASTLPTPPTTKSPQCQ